MRRLDGGQQENPRRSAFLFGVGIGVVLGVGEGIQFGAGRGLLIGLLTGLVAGGMRLLFPREATSSFRKNPFVVAFLLVLPFVALVAAALLA
jgi:hypothetical protein